MEKFKNKKEENAILKHFLVERDFWICQVQVNDDQTCDVKLSSGGLGTSKNQGDIS